MQWNEKKDERKEGLSGYGDKEWDVQWGIKEAQWFGAGSLSGDAGKSGVMESRWEGRGSRIGRAM